VCGADVVETMFGLRSCNDILSTGRPPMSAAVDSREPSETKGALAKELL
jgi:hypothetical protein